MSRQQDPAALAEEKHYTVPALAKLLSVSAATIRTIFAAHPRVRYLPPKPGPGRKCRTMLIPIEVYREVYARDFRL